jgi:hypothetical protein
LRPEPKLQKTALPRRSRTPARSCSRRFRARGPLQKVTDQLRETAEANQGKATAWWRDVRTSGDDQIATIRRDIVSKKAEHDLKAAQRNADDAEEDAKFPIAYAYWAVEEAGYRLLDAAWLGRTQTACQGTTVDAGVRHRATTLVALSHWRMHSRPR